MVSKYQELCDMTTPRCKVFFNEMDSEGVPTIFTDDYSIVT